MNRISNQTTIVKRSRKFSPYFACSSYLVIAAALAILAAAPAARGQTTWYVDDNAPADPGPGDPTVSDPDEDGSADHPFDAIQEGIDAAVDGDEVLVLDGTYTGEGNKNLDYAGKAITVRSESGSDNCVIDCERDGRGFYFHSGETATSVLDGFTIASGDVDDGSPGDGDGGGIYCRSSSPTITNCVINGNEAQNRGGGIYCLYSDAMLSDCVIINNRLARVGTAGGGIHCADANPTIQRCHIRRNVSAYLGGGVSCDESSPVIIDCTIAENIAADAGGGIRCSYASDPVIQDCVISENVARGNYGGGGVYCYGSNPTVLNSVIRDNSAVESGGGIVVFDGPGLTSMPTIAHCVISGNSADGGGGVHVASGIPTIVNSVVRGNAPEQVSMFGDEPVITYCNIEGGWSGEGNIDADPLFALADDWRILSGSPCIDAGTNELPGSIVLDDIDGTARPLDGDGDGVAVADIGIHEFTADMPSIALSARNLEFFVHEDNPLAAEQTLLIRNCGGVTLNWDINVPCSWLVVDPSSGVSGGEINEVAVSADATGLSHGKYVCGLSVVDPDAANSPQTVHVILHVATTLPVPGEYPTIGSAMDAATVAGDVVLVADGVYAGAGNKNLDFRGRAITVCSENGPWNCIIDCVGGGRAFNFDSREAYDSIVEGFTITHGREDVAGAIRCRGFCTPVIRNCVLTRNEAIGELPKGRGGAILCAYFADPAIVNCVFAENSALMGGAVFSLEGSRPTLTNCTIINNPARESGGGLCSKNSYPALANCVLWGNTGAQLYYSGEGMITVSYSNVEGGWEGEGNIDADPLFAFADDPHLLAGSPCIDSATNDPPGGLPPTDLDGNPRPIDGDEDGVAVADMGACEFDPAQPAIALSPMILEFYGSEGQTGSLDQTLFIRNSGGGVLNWNIVPQDPRVTVDPPSGDSTGETDEITVTLYLEGLSHGTHAYTLEISDPQASNSPRTVEVLAHISGTLRVPTDYPTIQDAIDAATEQDDVVLVSDGVYTGVGNKELDFYGRTITVRSENGLESCVIDCEGDGRAFVFHGREDAGAVMQGFTITNGYAGSGAGVYCYNNSSPTIIGCAITGNTASYCGGAVNCYDNSSPTITDCTITGNTASYHGGAVYCYDNSSPTITGCAITENAANRYGGGVYCASSSNPVIADCMITENVADDNGGGVCCRINSSPTITGCTIRGNAGSYGGGIYCRTANPAITGCTITGNAGSYGGGVFCADSNPAITNCTITWNAASQGGGVSCHNDSSPTIDNCILWGDSPDEIRVGSSSPVVTYCDIEGGWSGNGNIDADPLFVDPNDGDYRLSAGSPCIDAACNCNVPWDLVDLDGDGVLLEYVPFDLDGEGRFFDDPATPDTGSGLPPIVDMGAYEFGGSDLPPCHGDLDGDRDVDLDDLAVLLAHYGVTSGANGADGDMDCDGDVEISDLAELLGVYGTVCD